MLKSKCSYCDVLSCAGVVAYIEVDSLTCRSRSAVLVTARRQVDELEDQAENAFAKLFSLGGHPNLRSCNTAYTLSYLQILP